MEIKALRNRLHDFLVIDGPAAGLQSRINYDDILICCLVEIFLVPGIWYRRHLVVFTLYIICFGGL